MKNLIKEMKKIGWSVENNQPPYIFSKPCTSPEHAGKKIFIAAPDLKELYLQLKRPSAEVVLKNPIVQAEFVQAFRETERMTFQEIGDLMGFSRQRAQQLYKTRTDMEKIPSKWEGKAIDWRSRHEAGESIYLIAKNDNTTPQTVKNWLQKMEVNTSRGLKRKREK